MKKPVNLPNQKHTQEVLQCAPFGTFQADLEGNVFFVNKKWEDISGTTEEKSLGKDWMKIILDEDNPKVAAIVEKAVQQRKDTFAFQYRINHPQRGIRHLKANVSPVIDQKGTSSYFIGYVQDITQEHLAHEELIQAEKRQRELSTYLHSLITLIKDIIFEIDGNKVFRKVWARDDGQLFMPKEKFLNKTVEEVFGELAQQFVDPIEQAIHTGKKTEIQYQHIDSNVEKWYRAKIIPVEKHPNPEEFRLAFIIQDITERKKFLKELENEKERLERDNAFYDLSQKLSKTGGWEHNFKTGKTIRTRQMNVLVGLPPDEKLDISEVMERFFDEENRSKMRRAMEEAVTLKKMYDIELSLSTSQGKKKWIRSIAIPLEENGETVKLRGVVMDITEQKQNEQALISIKEKLEKSNQLLDIGEQLSNMGGWEYNLKSGIVFWTQQMYRIYEVPEGFDPSDFEHNMDFFPEEYQEKMRNQVQMCIEDQKPYVMELELHTYTKNKKWVRAFGTPIIKDGEVVMLQGALLDITKEKEDALRLLKAKESAEKATKVKSNFLSVMSHEIRTPLNGIIGIANLLKQNHTTEQEESANNLLFSAEHLLQLINNILDLNKIESHKLELKKSQFDLLKLIRNIKNQFQSLAESKDLKLTSLLDPGIPSTIIGDPVRLNQILNNLVSNAIKYTEEGNITISIREIDRDMESVKLHFSVEDTGIGIPPELQEEVFEDFSQIQQSTHRKHSGTGLGLAITKRLIDLHNSQIFLESTAGKGSRFYFALEFDLADEMAKVDKVHDPLLNLSEWKNNFNNLNVLLVEDNRINMMVARKQLEFFGTHPDCAFSGEEALNILETQADEFHMALIDLHMPEMDGYKLSEIIREKYPKIHIVIFTADIMSEVRIKLAQINVYDILNKPFLPEDLLQFLLKANP